MPTTVICNSTLRRNHSCWRFYFWIFCLLRVAEYIICTYLIYHVYTLCMYATKYIFSRPLIMTEGHLPTAMVGTLPWNWTQCGLFKYLVYCHGYHQLRFTTPENECHKKEFTLSPTKVTCILNDNQDSLNLDTVQLLNCPCLVHFFHYI